MRVDGNLGSELHFEPNSYGDWKEDMKEMEPMQRAGDAYRYDFREDDNDYFTQPGDLYRAMTEDQKRVLCVQILLEIWVMLLYKLNIDI